MKKKNGFIATSLIYSFFLIFITLFLTIIADYLQDRVLLNTIEDGIKSDLNNQMTINDFELGDYVSFSSLPGHQFVVAKIDQIQKKIILYSMNFAANNSAYSSKFSNVIPINNDIIKEDILFSIDETTLNKIIGDKCTISHSGSEFSNYSCTETENRYSVLWSFSSAKSKIVGNGSYSMPFTFNEV